MKYRLLYDSPQGIKDYTVSSMTKKQAEATLKTFKKRYLNFDGSGKRFPNRKGFYNYSNPRLVAV